MQAVLKGGNFDASSAKPIMFDSFPEPAWIATEFTRAGATPDVANGVAAAWNDALMNVNGMICGFMQPYTILNATVMYARVFHSCDLVAPPADAPQ